MKPILKLVFWVLAILACVKVTFGQGHYEVTMTMDGKELTCHHTADGRYGICAADLVQPGHPTPHLKVPDGARCANGTLQSYVGTTCMTPSGYTLETGPFLSLTVDPAFVNVTVGTSAAGDFVRYSGAAFAAGASEVRGMLDLSITGYPGVIELSMLPGSGTGGVFVTLGDADVYYLSGSPPKAKLTDWLYPSGSGWSGTLSWAVLLDETPGDVMLTISGSQ